MRSFLLCTLLAVSFYASADLVTPNDRVVSTVLIRSEPNGSSSIRGKLLPGDSLKYVKSIDNYHVVIYPTGQFGYVSKGYSRIVSDVETGKLNIHFMDVGQGDSTLIKCPNGKNILIDSGSLSRINPITVRQYLLSQLDPRRQKIDTLIVTHPDKDHYSLLQEVLEGVTVGQAFWTGNKEDFKIDSFQTWFFNSPFKRVHLTETDFDSERQENTKIECGGARVYLLAAGVISSKSSTNALSAVLMIRFGDFEAVLTGDATTATEKVILDRYPADWLDIDLLKIGHHGSLTTSTSEEWAITLSPEVAVVSAGDENRFGHPREEVIKRLEPFTIESDVHSIKTGTGKTPNYIYKYDEYYKEAIFSTVTSGTIEVVSDGNGWEVFERSGQ
jgi:competence protein ComEC